MYTISFFLQKCKVEIDTSANIVYNGKTFIHREGAFLFGLPKIVGICTGSRSWIASFL
jgi:hypothetical protein